MPTNSSCLLPKTKDWKEFEEMVRDCASKKWNRTFFCYGRSGQKQNGIDIISEDNEIGIQCKNYLRNEKNDLIKSIRTDYEKIAELPQNIKKFVVATALDRDVDVQNFISLNKNRLDVEVMFWEDISGIIVENKDLYKKYYSSFRVNKTRNQLFSLAYFGVQIAELIGLTLGDRSESAMYCEKLRNGMLWINDIKTRYRFSNYVNGVENFALGDLSLEDIERYEGTDAYSWGKCIEKIVEGLLDDLDSYDKTIYLAGIYLGKFFCWCFEYKGIADNLIIDFVNVVKDLDISSERKEEISILAKDMKDGDKTGDIAGRIYDRLRLLLN